MIKKLLIFALLLFTISCTKESGDLKGSNVEIPQTEGGVQVAFSSLLSETTRAVTRAIVDEGDGLTEDGEVPVRWERDDEIYLWAKGSDGAFEFENIKFLLRQFTPTYDKARFIGTLPNAMEQGDYDYYSVSPKPTSVEGSVVTYNTTLINQDGKYNGNLDILRAASISGSELSLNSDGVVSQLDMRFQHFMHAMQITIPEGRMLMDNIDRLEITFPQPVLGTISFDITDFNSKPTYISSSNKVVVDFETPLKEGDRFWVFINPTDVDGELTFQAFNREQERIGKPLSTMVTRSMIGGEITPVNLTINKEYERTRVALYLTGNNLGEDPDSITITVADGVKLIKNNDTKRVSGNIAVFYGKGCNNKNYTVEYYTHLYANKFKGGEMKIVYDTPNVIKKETISDLSGVIDNKTESSGNRYSRVIPYLLFEDFSGITKDFSVHDNQELGAKIGDGTDKWYGEATNLSDYGITEGWTASRVGGSKDNKSIRICGREEAGVKYLGRLDSPPLSEIKSGKNPKVKVLYNYSGGENEWAGWFGKKGDPRYKFGWGTKTGAQPGTIVEKLVSTSPNDMENVVLGATAQGTSGNYSTITSSNANSANTLKATNLTRLTWIATCEKGGSLIQNGNYWLYIDNIKVSIVKE